MKTTAAFIALLAALPLLAAQDPALQPAEERVAANDAAAARAILKPFLKAHKNSAEGWVLLGRADLADGKGGRAEKRFKRALKADAHCADAFYWMGKLYEGRKKIDEAANEYQAALKCDPSHAGALAAWKGLKDQVSSDQ